MILLNHFILSAYLTSVTTLLLGLFVLISKRPWQRLYIVFAAYSFSVAFWSFCVTRFTPSFSDPGLTWGRLLHIGAALIPVLFLHFVHELLHLENSKFSKSALAAAYVAAGAFIILALSGLTLIGGITNRSEYSYPTAGPVYPFFFAYFASSVVLGIGLLLRAFIQSSGARRNQLKYLLLFSFIGYLGAMKHFLILVGLEPFPLYPYGTYAVPLYALAVVYAITRHRLLDIRVAITRTAVFLVVYACVLGFPLLAAFPFQDNFEATLGRRWWAWLLLSYASLSTAAHYANLHFQRRAESRLYAEERKAHEALRKISQNMMRFTRLKVLLGSSTKQLVRILQIPHAAIYLHNEEKALYERKGVWHSPPQKGSSLPASITANSNLLKDLADSKLPRVREELRIQHQSDDPERKRLIEDLERLYASVVIPAFKQNKLFGFVVLGEKRSGRMWTQDDLNILTIVANQAALAVENAQLHEAEEQRLIKEAIEQTAADIAYGVSHQFNNRLYVISILSSSQVLSVAEKDLTKMSNEELAGWVRKLAGELKKITEEAEMGGQISKGIMSLAKAIPENFKPIEISPIIDHAIEFVRIKHAKEKVEGEDLAPAILNGVPKDLPKILGNHAQIHDSLMNLLDNALDAVREKIYRARHGELPAAQPNYKGKIQVKAGVEKGRLVVAVEDDGIGIEKENMRRCFAPYFTTKATGIKGRGLGGHGLGLYFIKKIVEAHGGIVRAESEHAQWTRFTVELPIPKEEDLKIAGAA